MRSIMAKSIIIFFATVSSSLATTYHVSKSGNDINDGRSWATAWSTVDKVNSTMSIGDTVLFGTGIWYDSRITPPTGGDNNNWTVYACSSFVEADPVGGQHLAKIWGGTLVTDWIQHSGNIYKAEWIGSNCAFNGKCYTLGQGDSLVIPQTQFSYVDQAGEFFHDLAKDTIYAWCYGGGDPDSYTMIASCKPPIDAGSGVKKCFRFWGLDLQYGKPTVFWLSALCDSVFIEHCHIAKAGNLYHENPAAIFSANNESMSGEYNHVIACSLGWAVSEDDNTGGTPPASGYGHGGAISLYSQEHFYVDSCSVYGFVNYGICFKMGGGAGDAPYTGNVVRYSTVTAKHEGIYFYNYPDRDSAYGNIIWDCNTGIRMRGGAGGDPSLYEGRVFLANNTIYNVKEAFFTLEGGQIAHTCGEGNEALYNVSYKHRWDAPEKFFIGFPYATDGNCADKWTIDSNYYYDASQAFLGVVPYWTARTWSQWQNTENFDQQGYNIDPGLNNPANGDFSRPHASNEMNRTYGGRTWTIFGAWQPGDTGLINFNVRATDITETSANIRWNTNLPATSQVEYGPDTTYGFITPLDGNLVTDHGQAISGLDSSTTYNYHVISVDSAGNEAVSDNYTFATEPTPLIIDNEAVVETTAATATITWDTNKPATSQVEYGLDQSYGYATSLDTILVIDHSVPLEGLDPNTTYHYRVISRDAGGNEVLGGDRMFVTLANLARGITPQVCGSYPGYNVIHITDGLTNAYLGTGSTWASDESLTDSHWVEIDFGQNIFREVSNVVIYWAWNNYSGSWTTSQEYRIQSWDGGDYDDVAVVDNPPIDSVTITNLQPVTTSRIRIFQPAGMGPQDYPAILWVAELKIYGSDTLTGINQLTSDNLYYPEAEQEVRTDMPVLAVKNLSNIGTVYFQVDDNEQFSSPTESGPVPTLGASTITWQTPDTLKNDSTYYWRASSDNSLWTNSWRFTVKLAIHAYPVPFRTVDGHTNITFTNIPAESRIVIAAVSGSIVRTVKNAGPGDWVWDVKNDKGRDLASGVYLYMIEIKNGTIESEMGKLMVIR